MSAVQTITPTVRDAVNAFIAGWNAHSPRAVREAFTEDGRVSDPVIGRWASGADIEVSVQRALDRYRDVAFTVVSVIENGADRVMFEWRLNATVVAPDGRRTPFTLEGCDVCRLRDGKLTELRGYFDRAAIMDQLKAAGAA
jgi:ketosteroid isomerase-like protein